LGAVGSRVAQVLADSEAIDSLVVIHRDPDRVSSILGSLGSEVEVRPPSTAMMPPAQVTVLTAPGSVVRHAETALSLGSHVVSVSDDPADIRGLLGLHSQARARARTVVAAAAMAPGLTCVLAAYIRRSFDRVDEVHVARVGTGGPACARRHHAALAAIAVDWEDGEWRRRPGGSGRELVWFPEPVGGADCYRAGLGDPLLLLPAFPGCRRVTSRLAATRRDRVTSWLPMLRPPHPEGLVGAVRVEVRGWAADRAETKIVGASITPAVAASAVAAQAAVWAGTGRLSRTGAGGLAELVGTPGVFLRELHDLGVSVASFEGRYLEG
jgi:saccharopine dehydrogenase-like NADP-dependent oxidoreductase